MHHFFPVTINEEINVLFTCAVIVATGWAIGRRPPGARKRSVRPQAGRTRRVAPADPSRSLSVDLERLHDPAGG